MRTIQQARLLLPGTRQRVYDIDLVDLGGANEARFLVNFRYGWQGAVLEEGTRTTDPVSQAEATRIFESLIAARRNQGYHAAGEVAPQSAKPALAVVPPSDHPQSTILANRLRGLDGLSDIKAAALLRRLGELRLKRLAPQIAMAAGALMLEGKRLVALRTLPYTVHRTDDGTGAATALLEKLASHADAPVAETAAMLCAIREPKRAPDWAAFPPSSARWRIFPRPMCGMRRPSPTFKRPQARGGRDNQGGSRSSTCARSMCVAGTIR